MNNIFVDLYTKSFKECGNKKDGADTAPPPKRINQPKTILYIMKLFNF